MKIKVGGVADGAGGVVVDADLESRCDGAARGKIRVAECDDGDLACVGGSAGDEAVFGSTVNAVEDQRAGGRGDGDEGGVGRDRIADEERGPGRAIDGEVERGGSDGAGVGEREGVGERGAGLGRGGGAGLREGEGGVAGGEGIGVGQRGAAGGGGGGEFDAGGRAVGKGGWRGADEEQGQRRAGRDRHDRTGSEAGFVGIEDAVAVAVLAEKEGGKVEGVIGEIAKPEASGGGAGGYICERVGQRNAGGRGDNVSGIIGEREVDRRRRKFGGEGVGVDDAGAAGRGGGGEGEFGLDAGGERGRSGAAEEQGERGAGSEGDCGAGDEAGFAGFEGAVAV